MLEFYRTQQILIQFCFRRRTSMPRIKLTNGFTIDTDKDALLNSSNRIIKELSDFSLELKLIECLVCENTPTVFETKTSQEIAEWICKNNLGKYHSSYIRRWKTRLSKIYFHGKQVFDDIILSSHGRNGYQCNGYIDDEEIYENIEEQIAKRFSCPKLNSVKIGNMVFGEKTTLKKFRASIVLLSYLRKAPGTISEYDLIDLSGNRIYENRYHDSQGSIVSHINRIYGFEFLQSTENVTENPRFNKVVTSPKYRLIIDLILDMFLDPSEERFFNPALYSSNISISADNKVIFSIKNIYLIKQDIEKNLLTINGAACDMHSLDQGILDLYESISKLFHQDGSSGESTYVCEYEKPKFGKIVEYRKCLFRTKDIESLFAHSKDTKSEDHITKFKDIKFIDCIVDGDIVFKGCSFINNIEMCHTAFLGNVLFDNCSFGAETEKELSYSFRNSVFFKSVYFKNNQFSTKGLFANNCTISFEDASFNAPAIQTEDGTVEIVSEFIFRGNHFLPNTCLDFYQTNFGECRVEISDCNLSKTSINMNASCLLNRLIINDAGDIWNCDFRFSVGNRFVLANSNLTGIMKVSNLAQFELLNTTLFFGLIVSPNPEQWNFESNCDSVRIRSTERYINRNFYPHDAHPLLRACVNRKDIAKQILIIKECFHRTGDIAYEEQANQLYLALKSKVSFKVIQPADSSISIEQASENDWITLMNLAHACAPLDKHTEYTYWLLTRFAFETCFIAYTADKKPIGFISGFAHNGKGFIWQIGILPSYRNKGISQILIMNLVNKFISQGISSFEVTISSKNKNSLSAFTKFCTDNGFQMISRIPNAIEGETLYEIR